MQFQIFLVLCLALPLVSTQEGTKSTCESKFCEEDENYPEKILGAPESPKAKRSTSSDSFLTESKLCESKIFFTKPEKLRNSSNKLRTIVNLTELLRFEVCLSENFPCTFDIYPKTAKSFCHQKYTEIRLLAMDDERNCLVTEIFPVPTACDCMIDSGDFLQGVNRDLLQKP